jgi:type VI secretion system protein VasJ
MSWSLIKQLPPNTGGVLALPPPYPADAAALQAMDDAANWEALLAAAETNLPMSPFWLDLNYFTARALEGLGHADARRAVAEQFVLFTRRLPGLLELSFQDGTRCASDATRAWVKGEAAALGAGDVGAPAAEAARAAAAGPGANDGPPDYDEVVREAKALAKKRKTVEAVRLLQERMSTAPSPRERFRWRIALAGICGDAGEMTAAAAQFEALESEIDRHALEEWEPELALRVFQEFYLCEKKLSQNGQRNGGDAQARLGKLYARLCRLDIPSALAVEKRK